MRVSDTLLLLEMIFLSFHHWYEDDMIDSDGFSSMLQAPFNVDITNEADSVFNTSGETDHNLNGFFTFRFLTADHDCT